MDNVVFINRDNKPSGYGGDNVVYINTDNNHGGYGGSGYDGGHVVYINKQSGIRGDSKPKIIVLNK